MAQTEVKKKKLIAALPDELSVLKVGCAGNNPAVGGCAFSVLSD